MRRYLTFLNRLAMTLALVVLFAPELLLAQGRTYVPPQPSSGAGGSFVFGGPILLPNGTIGAPSLGIGSSTVGFYSGSGDIRMTIGAINGITYSNGGFLGLNSSMIFGWSSTGNAFDTPDTRLYRDAANTLALRNGVNAQQLNVYNTYTDASNYERGALFWSGNILNLGVQVAGTGTARSFTVGSNNTTLLQFNAGGAVLSLNSLGRFYPSANDSGDIGASTNAFQGAYLTRSIQGSKSKALTEGAATSVTRIAVAQTAAANYGGGSVGYTVYATDATDSQSLVGDVRFAMVNKAGTETCTIGEVGTPVLAESAGGSTLTCTWTCVTAAADTVDIQANCTSSLVQTTFTAETRGDMQKPNTWTPQ